MKKRGKLLVALVMVVMLVVGISLVYGGGEPEDVDEAYPTITWRFAHTGPPAHPYHVSAIAMKEYVEEQTQGNFTIELYDSSALGWERETLEGLQMGEIALTWTAAGPFAEFASAYDVFNLPFLFQSQEHMAKAINHPVTETLKDYAEDSGFYDLGRAGSAFRVPLTKDGPIQHPDDFRGMTFRPQPAPIFVETYEALGVEAVTTSFAELYSALQMGVVDGCENTPPSLVQMGFYEVTNHVTELPIMNAIAMLAVSKPLFDELPENYQQIILDAAEIAVETHEREMWSQVESYRAEMEDAGIEFTQPDPQPFIDATQGVRDKYLDRLSEQAPDLPDVVAGIEELAD